ncbi:acyl-CoA dehydrogenase family protein [Parasphingorhabdus halotolerans]|uniref:Acyl-CoA/acyl-ACP dehydrogenase n=1 Tax=Parasphingorhabdus halotolerans TaxID=2725558 RepID=A0A6H2DLI4_9SPHN|nr:acyl-CoA dehydrogenase family protein [Parasphingorhabdus halotolerans]QJB68815.1 acyl-CoA/acyl-ACP dehydrogenase [Parasphingorhabdus halotolerans]
MEFLLTEDQLTLTEGVREYFSGTHGPEVLRRLDEGDNRDPAIWQGLVEMGLPGLLVPEAEGGLGLKLLDAALIAAECGRACLAEPLVDTAFVAVPWLIANGNTADLAAIASGEKTMPLDHKINGWVADGDGFPWQSVDPLRNLTAPSVDATDDPHLLNLGALMSAAQLVGIADAMLEQAVEYAKVRNQFGQPIGAFQAVKHHLAKATVALEFAKPVVWRAAQAMDDGIDSAQIHVSHAKLAAGDAALQMAETAIQIHGAMGYTYEVDLHFWMKRSWALIGAWGSRAFHSKRIDDAVIAGSLDIGPAHTFA